jgi:serine/threonine-protein kinase
MSPERWRAVKAAVAAALECEESERDACVDRLCGSDVELRREVESLLTASEGASELHAQPAIEAIGAAANLAERLTTSLADRYRLTRELGGGGMSRVFVATELALGRQVVVKVLPQELAAGLSVDRFKREIAFVARLQHANIVPLLNAGEVDGLPFYTMPLVEGLSLRAHLDRTGPMGAREAIAVLRDVSRALAYAHDHGVVHRDIKPHNILIAGGAAVVTDFGIAKALSAARTATTDAATADGGTLTQLGTALGTPAYMPPEQAAGDAVGPSADVYALGCTAYELLSGRPPFHGRTSQQLMAAHIAEPPPALTPPNGQMPPALATLVMRCLAKDPAARPTAAEVAQVLDDGAVLQPLPSVVAPTDRASLLPRGRVTVTLVIAGTVLLLAPLIARNWKRDGPLADSPRSVAVLRLDNVGGDTTNDYFAAGLGEELTNALAKVDGLEVRLSGADSAGTAAQRRNIARKLGVSALLQGSVQRSGDRLRIRVRLVNGGDDRVLWSNTYDRVLADVFSVQSDIADSVAASLRLTLSRAARTRVESSAGTRDAEAYLLYLQGRYAAARYTESDLRRGIALYQQAIRLDSTFARAWAGMADAWSALAGDFLPPREALLPARESAQRAVTLDSTLADAYIALGNVLLSDWDAAGAAAAFGRAVELERNSAATHYYAASALLPLGQFEEALDHAMTAHRLEPTQPAYATAVAFAHLHAGRFDSAAVFARRAYELDSSFTYAATVLGDALRLNGRPRDALDAYASRGPPQTAYDMVGPALARMALGDTDDVRRRLREIIALSSRQNVPGDAIAMVHAALGERDEAFAWLDSAYASHSAALVSLATDPTWAPLRRDRRFAALLQRVRTRTLTTGGASAR